MGIFAQTSQGGLTNYERPSDPPINVQTKPLSAPPPIDIRGFARDTGGLTTQPTSAEVPPLPTSVTNLGVPQQQAPTTGADVTQPSLAPTAPVPGAPIDYEGLLGRSLAQYEAGLAGGVPEGWEGSIQQQAMLREQATAKEAISRRNIAGATPRLQQEYWQTLAAQGAMSQYQTERLQQLLPMIDVAKSGWEFEQTLGFQRLELAETLKFKREELDKSLGMQKYGIDVQAGTARYGVDIQAATARYQTDIQAAVTREQTAMKERLGMAQLTSQEKLHAESIAFDTLKLDATVEQWGAENQLSQNRIDAEKEIAQNNLAGINSRFADQLEQDKQVQLDRIAQWGEENNMRQDEIDNLQDRFDEELTQRMTEFNENMALKLSILEEDIRHNGVTEGLTQQQIDNNLIIAREEIAANVQTGQDQIEAQVWSDVAGGLVTVGSSYWMAQALRGGGGSQLATTAIPSVAPTATTPGGVPGPGSGVSGPPPTTAPSGTPGPGSGISTPVAPVGLAQTATPTLGMTTGPAGAASTGGAAGGTGAMSTAAIGTFAGGAALIAYKAYTRQRTEHFYDLPHKERMRRALNPATAQDVAPLLTPQHPEFLKEVAEAWGTTPLEAAQRAIDMNTEAMSHEGFGGAGRVRITLAHFSDAQLRAAGIDPDEVDKTGLGSSLTGGVGRGAFGA